MCLINRQEREIVVTVLCWLQHSHSMFNSIGKKMLKKFRIFIFKAQPLRRAGASLGAALFVVGCATVPPPIEQVAISKAAVNNASSAGGNEFAPVELKSAMEKVAEAERAMATKDYLRARYLAEQAQVDAQLAGAMARSAKAQKAALTVQEDSRVLQQEIDRKTK